jgi:hypothetical protein
MPRDTEDTRKPRLRCVQIKGAQDDELLTRLEKYSQKKGIQVATAARMLIRAALDLEEGRHR